MSLLLDQKALERVEPSFETVETPLVSPVMRVPERAVAVPAKKPRFSALGVLLKTGTLTAVLVFGAAFAVEHFGPTPWRPSTMLGAFGGKMQTADILEQIDAQRAFQAMQFEEQGRMAKEVERYRSLQERLTQAYRAEFDRGNQLVQAGAMAAQQLLQANTMAKIQAMEGKQWEAGVADRIGAICSVLEFLSGSNSECSRGAYGHAANKRDEMEAEIVGSFRRQQAIIAAGAQSWAQGLMSPAEFIAQMKDSPDMQIASRQPVPRSPAARTD